MKLGFLLAALGLLLSGCNGLEHAGCPGDMETQNSGSSALVQTCN